jgi:hypothetical protein
MKIELEVSEDNEATASPWWLVIDPEQNFLTDTEGACHVANMIHGPFFSRAEGEQWRLENRHNLSPQAIVYCHSAPRGSQYYSKVRF